MERVVLLAGGVGASKLAVGLGKILKPGALTIVSNVGDDEEVFGLHVSPDIDIVTYAMVGIVDDSKGWGVAGDSFNCDAFLRRLGEQPWLLLGDRDLAVNIVRTNLLKQGLRLSQITKKVAESLGATHAIIPATDNRLTTYLRTDVGLITFERYYVKEGQKPEISGVTYAGSGFAEPAPGVLEAIEGADLIIFAPSNPVASIQPILSVKKVRRAVMRSGAFRVAISPIVGGRTVKGPADKMMRALGYEVSPNGLADFYEGLLDCMVIDSVDAGLREEVMKRGLATVVEDTMMTDFASKVRLAESVLNLRPST
ncbi:MAG TPA: 2-phospho-L-lactate transferase [Conexivisphaerales archaeon]|nr:2-phospho-L-lactate transferase [Conexivisphaerales archaeon]